MSEPTHYAIPAGLLGATLDYLGKRPFVEVADAIIALRNLQPVDVSQGEPQPDESPEQQQDLSPGERGNGE